MYASWIWGNRIVPYAGPGLKAEGYGNPKRRADRIRRFIDLCGGGAAGGLTSGSQICHY